MARQVHEIMSRELFSLTPGDDVAGAAESILGLGVTAAPVLDDDRNPVGVASLRDLMGTGGGGTVADRMSTPVATVPAEADIEDASRRLASANVHRLVVVDGDGRAVGIVSSIDLVRALLGLPVPHPSALPHLDLSTGLSWCDDTVFDADYVDAAPNGPGIFMLIRGGRGEPEVPMWVEASPNVRTRLSELMSVPQEDPDLRHLIDADHQHLRFRAATVTDAGRREELVRKIRAQLPHGAPR